MEVVSSVLVFPGQGSQKIGMGKDLYDNFAVAKDVFDRIDEALNFKLSHLMFEGDLEELNKTSNAQPAIMAASMAYFEVLKSLGLVNSDEIKFMAGHSLGEYSALCAAGSLSLEDTARLLKLRGAYMMQACIDNPGAMAALIGFDYAKAEAIADMAGCFVGNSNSPAQIMAGCFVGNSNSPAQIVLSGSKDTVEKACEIAKEQGVKRAVMLPVSGAFHSPLMQSAADKMADVIANTKFSEPKVKVISNLTAKEYSNTTEIKDLLVKQITNTVKWQESVVYMQQMGAGRYIECGFGNVLSGLIKKTLPDAEVITAEEMLKSYAQAV